MVHRFAVGAAVSCVRPSPSLLRLGRGLALLVVLGPALVGTGTAQDPTPPAPAPEAAAAAAPKFGRVLVEGGKLRCWPSAAAVPPVFEDTLAKDQVVQVGRSESGFRQVILPLGPLGYVAKKFAVAGPDGVVATKGSKVAFRYRPRTDEAPVTFLEDGKPVAVVGEHEEWWRVRVATVEAWLPEAEVQVAEPADAALAAAYAETAKRYEGEVQARLDQIATAKKLEAQNAADLAAVQVVQDAFAAELKKPISEQQFAPLDEALDKLDATLAPESAGKPAVVTLKKRIETQRFIVEATAVRDSKPVPAADVGPPPQPKDELERFQSIGWLRYEMHLAGPGVYYLEKGGRRQYVLSCNSRRYDLALFVDREVGVMGPRRRPATESLSVLDVERLEVLGTTQR